MAKRILVVDDNAMNLKMASMILERKQYEVLLAESGQKCLEVLEDEEVDMVLLDIAMPDMDGIQTFKEIRKQERGKNLPILFLTASEDIEEETAGLDSCGYVKKPFLPQVLQEQVFEIIGE